MFHKILESSYNAGRIFIFSALGGMALGVVGCGVESIYKHNDKKRIEIYKSKLIKWHNDDFIGDVQYNKDYKQLAGGTFYSPNGGSFVSVCNDHIEIMTRDHCKIFYPDGNTRYISVFQNQITGQGAYENAWDESGNEIPIPDRYIRTQFLSRNYTYL